LEGVCFEVDDDDVFGPDMVVVVLLEEADLVVDMTNIKESQEILDLIVNRCNRSPRKIARVAKVPGQLLDSTRLEPASSLNEILK
jgi:hypothetical protein